MQTVHLSAITRADGSIVLAIPTEVGAGQAVQVEVRIDAPQRVFKSKREWQAWVKRMAGSITDPTFERPEQPNLD